MLVNQFRSLSCALIASLTVLLSGCGTTSASMDPLLIDGKNVLTENFDQLSQDRWEVSNWAGFWQKTGLKGNFDPKNAYLDGNGNLVLALNVQNCAAGLCAQAAEVQTKEKLSFGRYTVRMRTASTSPIANRPGNPQPGNISAAFSFVGDSDTEIDIEIQGLNHTTLDATVWKGLKTSTTTQINHPQGKSFATAFHTYTYDWQPDRLTYYLDGRKIWETTKNIPQEPAYFMLNLWPTITPKWGGKAVTGKVFMLVDSFRYEPSL